MTNEEKSKIIEEYLGVSPKYFYYSGNSLKVDVSQIEVDSGEPLDRRGPWIRGIHYQQQLKSGKIIEPL